MLRANDAGRMRKVFDVAARVVSLGQENGNYDELGSTGVGVSDCIPDRLVSFWSTRCHSIGPHSPSANGSPKD